MPQRVRRKDHPAAEEAPAAEPAPSVYEQIEAVLAALPEDMPNEVRRRAMDLLAAVFGAYLEQRLGLEKK